MFDFTNILTSKASLAISVIACIVTVSPIAVADDAIVLRSRATISGNTIRLSDVARLKGDYAQSFAKTIVGELRANSTNTTLSVSDIRRKLITAKINWAKVVFRGSIQTQIHRVATSTAAKAASNQQTSIDKPTPSKNLNANQGADISQSSRKPSSKGHIVHIGATNLKPAKTITPKSIPKPTPKQTKPSGTMRTQLETWIVQQLGQSDIDLQSTSVKVNYANSADPMLALPSSAGDFHFTTTARSLVGRNTIHVRRYQEENLVGSHRIRVNVSIGFDAVTIKRTIYRGQTITEDDVEIKRHWVSSSLNHPLTDLAAVVGQEATATIKRGSSITRRDVRARIVVRRGQSIEVHCKSGALLIKTVATAMGQGGVGESIRVRNEKSKKSYRVRIIGPGKAEIQVNPKTLAVGKKGVRK